MRAALSAGPGPRDEQRRGPLIAIAATDAPALVTALADDGIVTSSRDGNLRVSPHCYNTTADITTLLEALSRHRALLRLPSLRSGRGTSR